MLVPGESPSAHSGVSHSGNYPCRGTGGMKNDMKIGVLALDLEKKSFGLYIFLIQNYRKNDIPPCSDYFLSGLDVNGTKVIKQFGSKNGRRCIYGCRFILNEIVHISKKSNQQS